MNNREQGFAHLLLAIFILLIAAIAGAGYLVWKNQDKDSGPSPTLQKTAAPCEGRLYDSHAHPDDDAILERLPDLMTKYDIGCSVLFTQMDISNIDEGLLDARERYSGMPGRVSIFYDVIGQDPSEVTREKLDELYEKSVGEFTGFGEFAFYQDPLRGTSLESDPWSLLFEFAAEKDLAIMIHPEASLLPSLESMLSRYPDTRVIVHGAEFPDKMADLLKTYPNLYFTLDTATLLAEGEPPMSRPMMYPGGGPNTPFDVDEFVGKYNANRQQIIDQAVEFWLPVFLAAPEKVMWGTDISLEGHVDADTYGILMDITDALLAKIPKKYQEGYLHDNAFNLLGGGSSLKPLTESELNQLDDVDEDDDSEEN